MSRSTSIRPRRTVPLVRQGVRARGGRGDRPHRRRRRGARRRAAAPQDAATTPPRVAAPAPAPKAAKIAAGTGDDRTSAEPQAPSRTARRGSAHGAAADEEGTGSARTKAAAKAATGKAKAASEGGRAKQAEAAPLAPAGAAEPKRFAWAPVDGAVGYRFELFRGDKQVLEVRTKSPAYEFASQWRHAGRTETLTNGRLPLVRLAGARERARPRGGRPGAADRSVELVRRRAHSCRGRPAGVEVGLLPMDRSMEPTDTTLPADVPRISSGARARRPRARAPRPAPHPPEASGPPSAASGPAAAVRRDARRRRRAARDAVASDRQLVLTP